MPDDTTKFLLLALFNQAVLATSAKVALPAHLPAKTPRGRTLVLGAGKAAAAMAAVTAETMSAPLHGIVVTRYGHDCEIPGGKIAIACAAHPVPDEQSTIIARKMLSLAQGCTPEDRMLFLASGGGSSVLSLPAPGLSLLQKQDIIRHLLHSGADIAHINCVRKHLSSIKGGRLAVACGTRDIHTFIISDVPGDAPSAIASGPTIADPTSLADARAVITRYGTPHEEVVVAALNNDANETPKPGTLFEHHTIIAKAEDALTAAAKLAQAKGWQVHNLGDRVEGEARKVGARHANISRKLKARGGRWLLMSGGETTVTVRHKNGGGGPNLEYLAGLALALNGEAGITALSCDTDGIDGSEDNAGAYITPSTLSRATALGLDINEYLENNRTYAFFKALDDLIITGPTLTNVNDFRIIAIES
ncbi:MAG: glycerate kinase [Robiginitomaculum sp.]|nr:MAG: glycerate kinase [Robiginitomaculum sp.]